MSNNEFDWNGIFSSYKDANTKKNFPTEQWKLALFKPKLKSDGTWNGVIRFLPRPVSDSDRNPVLKVEEHSFQKNGWFIEKCPHLYGEPCPVCEYNQPIYGAGGRPDGTQRKTSFFVNILVVEDPQNPENVGKVFIYKIGKKIHELIKDRVSPPEDSSEQPMNIYHPTEGTNFKLKIKLVRTRDAKTNEEKEYPNFDMSCFYDSPRALDEAAAASALSQLHSLDQICSPSMVKSYEDLKARFGKVMNINAGFSSGSSPKNSTPVESSDLPNYNQSQKVSTVNRAVVDDGADDDDDFIRSLQNGN